MLKKKTYLFDGTSRRHMLPHGWKGMLIEYAPFNYLLIITMAL